MYSDKIVKIPLERPRLVLTLALVICLTILAGVAAPFVQPSLPLPELTIDTDPENMLSADDPARVFNRTKSTAFGLRDTIVVVVTNDNNTEGVFTPAALADIAELSDYAASLNGVVAGDIVSITTIDMPSAHSKDGMTHGPLMPRLPANMAEARTIRDHLAGQPFYGDMFLSQDGKALALQIPVAEKNVSHAVGNALRDKIEQLDAGNSYYLTGLPIAQAQFGVEMFKQMAIAAPAAMALIFVLLFAMFRSWHIALAPMAVAMTASIAAMGALVLTGQTIHIMSSMIPIFVMPIAVMDAIHILSDFAEHYGPGHSRRTALQRAIRDLWRPMLFTTVTTCAGFASLALAPIPPVQVFGLYVALGVAIAWAATMLMVPAMLMLLPRRAFARLPSAKDDRLGGIGQRIARVALWRPGLTLMVMTGAFAVALGGLFHVRVNDNPINWFTPDHEIRQAETLMSERFGGAHMAYLSLSAGKAGFENPEMLSWVARLQTHIEQSGLVSASVALPDIVGKAWQDMQPGTKAGTELPETSADTARILDHLGDQTQNRMLAKLVNADRSEVVVLVQMQRGDNQDMLALQLSVDAFLTAVPAPVTAGWFGLAHLNAVWQDKMVSGMLQSLAGGYAAVFLLMLVLFRSIAWASLAIIPLTISIGGLYGAIGWMGRDFDMPIAVLSALSLGLSVDFAIHFIERLRQLAKDRVDDPLLQVYGEPAKAIWRNALVLGVGFLPLLLSPLVPYQTVGMLIPAILWIAAATTLLFLGASVRLLPGRILAAPQPASLTQAVGT